MLEADDAAATADTDVVAIAVVAEAEESVSVVEVLLVAGCLTSQADVGNSLSTGGSSWS